MTAPRSKPKYAPPLASFDPRLKQLLITAAKPGAEPITWTANTAAELHQLRALRLRFHTLRKRMSEEKDPLADVVYSVAVSFTTPRQGQPGYGSSGILTLRRHDDRFDDMLNRVQTTAPTSMPALDLSDLQPETDSDE